MGKIDANENSADMTMSTTHRQTACGPAREPHAEGAYLSEFLNIHPKTRRSTEENCVETDCFNTTALQHYITVPSRRHTSTFHTWTLCHFAATAVRMYVIV